MLASPEDTLEPGPDYSAAMEALSSEERNALENTRLSMNQDRAKLLEVSEIAYATAVNLEDLRGMDREILSEYEIASRGFIGALGITMALETIDDGGKPTEPVNPVIYLKVADSLTKEAAAPELAPYNDRLASNQESRGIDRRAKLAGKAVEFWNRGIAALLEADPENAPEGIEIPEKLSGLVASAVVEAVKDADSTQEHDVLAGTSEEELATQLETEGPEPLLEVLPQAAGLEVISLASRRIEQELSTDEHPLVLAA